MKTIYLAAGCFWGVQYYFDHVDGVVSTEVGYMGGRTDHPGYVAVCYENTGHAEVTKVFYDDQKLPSEKLLKHFFLMHDPSQVGGQGVDIGDQYRSEVFYDDEEQKKMAEKVMADLMPTFKTPIVTKLEPARQYTFWPAEDYHQKYTERTGRGFCHVSPAAVADKIEALY